MSKFFRRHFFRNFFVWPFFPNFSENPKWPFLAKVTFSGHLSIFYEKFVIFFQKKSWFFSIFFEFFLEKKNYKKTQKNVILQKVRRSISGEITKSAKKNMRKKWIFNFLNPLQKCEFTKKRSFFLQRRKKYKTRFWRGKELLKTRKLLVAKLFFSPLAP